MRFFDSHSHLHDDIFKLDKAQAVKDAHTAGVSHIISVGTDAKLSQLAIQLAQNNQNMWASVGLHPHDAKHLNSQIKDIEGLLNERKVIAIGECGLDYYYLHSYKKQQQKALEIQLKWAEQLELPVILHVRSGTNDERNAFSDLWKIWDKFSNLKGVVHSFSSNLDSLNEALNRGLYIALNGIMTFSNDASHLEVIKHIPISKLLLESDAPFLTPKPYRGKINEPKYLVETAKFIASIREESLEIIATKTFQNTEKLFLSKK